MSALLVALAWVATACSASTDVADQATGATSDVTTLATVERTEPTDQAEPTAVPAPRPTSGDNGTPAPAAPTTVPEQVGTPADFRADSIQALSGDGVFAYAGTSSPWNLETACDATPVEALAVAHVVSASNGESVPIGAGLKQAGDVRQVLFGEGTRAIIVSSCGPGGDATLWMQRADFGQNGVIAGLGEIIPLPPVENESEPYVLRWTDLDTIEARVIVEVDPDDFDTWLIQRRRISTVTGEVLSTQEFASYDDSGWAAPVEVVSPGGQFTYRSIADPGGSLGCEGQGVSRTIEVEGGGARRLAVGPGLAFSSVDNLHFSADGFVAWTTSCEGFTTAYVGVVQDDGTIVDTHYIDSVDPATGAFFEFQKYRLTSGGYLAAVGQSYDPETGEGEVVFWRYDLATDPNFVNTAVPALDIDRTPLFGALDEGESWHVGDTLGEQPACGASTLYGMTSAGFVRAFPATREIDTIVDVDLAETRVIEFDDGTTYESRTVAFSVGCPSEYDGRRVYFGTETGNVQWGLGVFRADLGEVAEVLLVRDQLEPGTNYVQASFAEVRLLDGTVAELELVDARRS